MNSSRMTTYIIVAMVLDIAAGGLIDYHYSDLATRKLFATYIRSAARSFCA